MKYWTLLIFIFFLKNAYGKGYSNRTERVWNYTYNSKGERISQLESKTVFEFDSLGKIVTIKYMGRKEMLKNKRKGGSLQITHKLNYDAPKQIVMLSYDSVNRLSKEETFYVDDENKTFIEKKSVYQYFKNGYRVLDFMKNDLLWSSKTILIDSIERSILCIDSAIYSKYTPKGINVKTSMVYFDEKWREKSCVMDENGNFTKKFIITYSDLNSKQIDFYSFAEEDWQLSNSVVVSFITDSKRESCLSYSEVRYFNALEADESYVQKIAFDKKCRLTEVSKIVGGKIEAMIEISY